MRKYIISLIIIIISIILDQISKSMAVENFAINPSPTKITDFFNVVLTFNRGISFGMFGAEKYANLIFTISSSLIVIFLISWIKKEDKWVIIIPISLIIGGAIGNVIDRFKYGAVVDFLDFFYNNFHWPAFNLADAFITIAVVILGIENFITSAKKEIK